MDKANPLVPDTTELEVADNWLASLTDMAYAIPGTPVAKPKEQRRFKSRFFFRMSKSVAEETEARRRQLAPKEREHVDSEIEGRATTYKQELPAELAANIDDVREFFLREIAPMSFAFGAGAAQALNVARRTLNSDIDTTQFEKMERMAAHAIDIKMARFVSRSLGMTKKEARLILARMNPPRPQIVPVGVPHGRQEGQKGKEKAS